MFIKLHATSDRPKTILIKKEEIQPLITTHSALNLVIFVYLYMYNILDN